MAELKSIIKEFFKSLGLDISIIRNKPPNPLIQHKIKLLFDVGANVGQYALFARSVGYLGKIVSFEPLPDAYAQLLQKAQIDPLWTVHPRCAIGATIGEAEINIAQNSFSSSLLPMLQTHARAAPASVYIGKAATAVITLDSVFETYRISNETTFLKIDTQGFEQEVLEGVAINLHNLSGIQLELSTVPLYDHQQLYQYFFTFFESRGFRLWSILPGFVDRATGQMLQFDATFIKS